MPVRELYWNIGSHGFMYILFLIAVAIFSYGCYQKYQFWQLGEKENRNEPMGERFKLVLINALGHKRILREKFAGTMHSFIFYGFIVLFLGTVFVGLDDHLGSTITHTSFFLYFKFLLDIAGLLAIIGITMAIYRRYVVKPSGLDNKTDDAISLVLILVILLTGFFLEGLRLAVNPVPWIAFTPVGMALSYMFNQVFSNPDTMMALHKNIWWFHMIMAFTFIAYIPYSKMFHIISSTANQYWQNLEPVGALKPIDFEDESVESFGVSKIENFSWKQLFDAEACTRCGRCQDNCPAYLTEKPLTPKGLIQDLGDYLKEKAPIIKANQLKLEAESEVAATAEDNDEQLEKQLIGDVIDPEVIWSCTTCGSCQEQCPVFNEHIPKIMEMRRHLLLDEGDVSPEAQKALTNMERLGNPWGMGKATRIDWAKGLGVPTLMGNENPEVVYWVGCAGAFDARNQKVATALVKVLKAAGVNFSIIGNDEMCCGESARRLGNEYLYQSLAEGNIELLKEFGVKKIITHCPHCFNTLKNEYPQFGGDFQVLHHSQVLLDLITSKKLDMSNPLPTTVTYHDSCYLGRYNHIYQQPRQIISAIPQANLVEIGRNLEKSFCCGAGGGRMWMEETIGQRINEVRAEEAIKTGASFLVTGCPYCLTMMDDGVKAKQQEEQVRIRDIAEMVAITIKTDKH